MPSRRKPMITDSASLPDAAADRIPFLRTELPLTEDYLPYLKQIDSNRWYSNFGPLVTEFETQLLAAFFGDTGAVTTVSNCTLGLSLALQASCRADGKYVIMPSFTFAATPLAALAAGYTPYFVDVNEADWTVGNQCIEDAIGKLGGDVAAVMPYATFGTALELAYFQELEDRGIPVVVDAAPGLGTTNPDGTPFAKDFSGCVVFSLHATKPFGIGEGGLVYSGIPDTINTIRQLSNFGFTSPGIAASVGTNAKLPEISAAVGLAVLAGYAGKVARLEQLFSSYLVAIGDSEYLDIHANTQAIRGNVPHQLMPIILPDSADTDRLSGEMDQLGIGTRRYFNPPCHLQPALRGSLSGPLTTTEAITNRILCLPLWDGMDSDAPGRIITSLESLIK